MVCPLILIYLVLPRSEMPYIYGSAHAYTYVTHFWVVCARGAIIGGLCFPSCPAPKDTLRSVVILAAISCDCDFHAGLFQLLLLSFLHQLGSQSKMVGRPVPSYRGMD